LIVDINDITIQPASGLRSCLRAMFTKRDETVHRDSHASGSTCRVQNAPPNRSLIKGRDSAARQATGILIRECRDCNIIITYTPILPQSRRIVRLNRQALLEIRCSSGSGTWEATCSSRATRARKLEPHPSPFISPFYYLRCLIRAVNFVGRYSTAALKRKFPNARP